MFRGPGGAGLPSWETLRADIGATDQQLAQHLQISPRTVQRFTQAQQAPRAVMLAMFWESRWGRSAADCEAANFAALHFWRAEIAERQIVALRRQVTALELAQADSHGAANSPIWMLA